jgi:hypothetical protein
VIGRRRGADPAPAGPAHPGLLLAPRSTPGSGIAPGSGDGAPPRFTDGPSYVILRRL